MPAADIDEIRFPRLGLHFRLVRAFEFVARLICIGLILPFTLNAIAATVIDGRAIIVATTWFVAAVFGAITYVSWRNFGRMNLRRYRVYFVAIPLLTLLVAATLYRLQSNPERIQDSLVVLLGLLALIAFPSIIAIYFRRVRFAPLPRGKVRLKAITDPPRDRSHRRIRPRRSWKRRLVSLGFLAACLVLFVFYLAMYVTRTRWGADSMYGSYEGAAGFVAATSFVLFVMYRRYAQPTADEALQSDTRPPFLYLRSFDDDFDSHWRPINILRFMCFPLNMVFDYSLEDRISRLFRRFGPLVAIGSPKEKMPVLGAARVLLDDASWQAAVLKWMDTAKGIVVLVGHTEWLIWELRQIRERDLTRKALLIFPPAGRKNASERLETLRRAFVGSEWEPALAAVDHPNTLRAMILKDAGGIVTIRSHSRSRDTIHVSTMIAHYLLEKRPEWETARATTTADVPADQASDGASLPSPVTLRA